MANIPCLSRDQFYNVSQKQNEFGEEGSLRLPRSAPKVLGQNAEVQDNKQSVFKLAYENAYQPHRDYKAVEQRQQKYIPGLNQPDASVHVVRPAEPVRPKKDLPKEVPPDLIRDFMNGEKNPISALHEYCALTKFKIEFAEVAVDVPTFSAKFAFECRINNQPFKQGVGKRKKEAKTEAAKIAFTTILGIEDDDIDDEGNYLMDAKGQIISLPPDTTSVYRPQIVSSREYDIEKLAKGPAIYIPEIKNTEPDVKHPVAQLNELNQKRHMDIEILVNDIPSDEGFVGIVTINNKLIARALAHSKKEAKKRVAEKALIIIESQEQPKQVQEMTHFDKIAQPAIQKIYSLLVQIPSFQGNTSDAAAFVVKEGESDAGTVVAIGTGCTIISSGHVGLDGRCMTDCNAETIARRCLMKYFYKELKSLHNGNGPSIFTIKPGQPRAQLREGITLHLYLSRPSVGDASLFQKMEPTMMGPEQKQMMEKGAHFPNYNSNEYGFLRTHPTQGQITPELTFDIGAVQDLQKIKGGLPILTMAASDKIMKWNLLGLQGALLSHFMEPAYVTSMTVASDFDHGHLTRAYCCRVNDEINGNMPEGYILQHPYLGTLSKVKALAKGSEGIVSSLGLNWSDGDEKLEIVNGTDGRSTEYSPFRTGPRGASRLCKAGFYHRFKEMAKLVGRHEMTQFESYREAKASAQAYQDAKLQLYIYLRDNGFGTWIKKPPQIEGFVK